MGAKDDDDRWTPRSRHGWVRASALSAVGALLLVYCSGSGFAHAAHDRHMRGPDVLSADAAISAMIEEGVSFTDPEVWGPAGWFLIHSIALTLPDSVDAATAETVARLFDDLAALLPCRLCGQHLAEYIAEHPLRGGAPLSRGAVFEWTRAAHNAVNARNAKPEVTSGEALAIIREVYERQLKWTLPVFVDAQ